MMYINGSNTNGFWERSWHVGETLRIPDEVAAEIYQVQADGHELAHIVQNMPNVPYARHKRVNRWFGDMAQFIAANL